MFEETDDERAYKAKLRAHEQEVERLKYEQATAIRQSREAVDAVARSIMLKKMREYGIFRVFDPNGRELQHFEGRSWSTSPLEPSYAVAAFACEDSLHINDTSIRKEDVPKFIELLQRYVEKGNFKE